MAALEILMGRRVRRSGEFPEKISLSPILLKITVLGEFLGNPDREPRTRTLLLPARKNPHISVAMAEFACSER
jgi:hypothetical protein